MSMSIEELDATVRAFYEGRGDTVCSHTALCSRQDAIGANNTFFAAKASAGDAEPGTLDLPTALAAWPANRAIVQREPRCLAPRR